MQYWLLVLIAYAQQPGSSFLFRVYQENQKDDTSIKAYLRMLFDFVLVFWVFFSHLLDSPLVSGLQSMQRQLWGVWWLYLYFPKQYYLVQT